MKRGIRSGDEMIMECNSCHQEYDLVTEKRRTCKNEPIRCPHCGNIVAR